MVIEETTASARESPNRVQSSSTYTAGARQPRRQLADGERPGFGISNDSNRTRLKGACLAGWQVAFREGHLKDQTAVRVDGPQELSAH